MGRNDEFFHGVHVSETEKRLFQTREKVRKSTALHPGDMDADDVDYEMQFPKNPEELVISGMNQSGLERFVERYGRGYRRLNLNFCQHISDLSPLEELKELEMLTIDWNIRAQRLWDMSKNPALWSFYLVSAKKISYEMEGLQTAKGLRKLKLLGPSNDGTYPMRTLDCLSGLPALEKLELSYFKPEDRSIAFLDTLPSLREFNFEAGLFTTEVIAQIVAKYPELHGEYLCACNDSLWGMRVSGYKKPTLSLPKDQKRLDKYCAEFQALVEKYKAELKK